MKSVAEFLDWLVEHGFISDALADELANSPGTYSVAMELIQRGLLTPYQAKKILNGRGKSLLLDAYRILDRVGHGGMGRVYRAWHTKLKMPVAIKMVNREHLGDQKAIDRFSREMETAAYLKHPNIVLIRDAGESNDRPFLVMDFVEGLDVFHLVEKRGALPISEACEIARQAAQGLQHAFERGIVHRDIKPSNLLVTSDEPPIVKILDFGLARFKDEQRQKGITQLGAVLGTVEFMAPEQAMNASSADVRSDLYSLGSTLFFMLAGHAPFEGENMMEKLAVRLTSDPPSIREIRADVPVELDQLLFKMLARKPEDRWQTPVEVARALARFTTPVRAAAAVGTAANGSVTGRHVPADAPPGSEDDSVPTTPITRKDLEAPAGEGSLLGDSMVDEPFAFGDDSRPGLISGGDTQQDAKPAPPHSRATPKPNLLARLFTKGQPEIWLGAGGALLVLLIVGLVLMFSGGVGPPTPGSITVAAAPSAPKFRMREGGLSTSQKITIRMVRNGYKGPVSITLENLPDGIELSDKAITIPESRDKVDVTLFATRDAAYRTSLIDVIAAGEGVSDRTSITIEVIAPVVPEKKGK